jgi:hypothetical protein
MTDNQIHDTGILAGLDAQPDDVLLAVIGRAKGVLAARKRTRQREAAATIRRLARQHELDVSVALPSGRPGRPRREPPA